MSVLQLYALDVGACWERLSSTEMGRVGVSVHAMPVILPVFFVIDAGRIIFRTITGTKFASATDRSVVAFEADGYSSETREGWSVLVQGMTRTLSGIDEVARAASLPLLAASSAGSSDQLVAIDVSAISGRSLRAS